MTLYVVTESHDIYFDDMIHNEHNILAIYDSIDAAIGKMVEYAAYLKNNCITVDDSCTEYGDDYIYMSGHYKDHKEIVDYNINIDEYILNKSVTDDK